MPTNDNDPNTHGGMLFSSDAYGRAALLLVESLIHGLCANASLGSDEAIEIAERAVSVQFDQAEAADGAGEPMRGSHALLSLIAASLRTDVGDPPKPPRLVS